MKKTLSAKYENGAFRPLDKEQLSIPEGAIVAIVVDDDIPWDDPRWMKQLLDDEEAEHYLKSVNPGAHPVIIPDLNLLIYAYDQRAPQHPQAHLWWAQLLRGDEPVGMPWVVLTGFVRLTIRPGILAQPLSSAEAIQEIQQWLANPARLGHHPVEHASGNARHSTPGRWQRAQYGNRRPHRRAGDRA